MGFLKAGTIETLYLKFHNKNTTLLSAKIVSVVKHQNHPEIGLFDMPYFTTIRKDGKLWQA